MKTTNVILMLALLVSALFHQCKKDDDTVAPEPTSVLPENFKVDIPSSLSNNQNQTLKSTDEGFSGGDIYMNLNTFIFVGEASADIVEDIILWISKYNINQAMSISYISDDDNRSKNLVVVENVEFEGKAFEFKMTITDAESEMNADGGKAIQIFWNTNPIDGIAILKPYNIDRINNAGMPEAMYRIDYSETGSMGYTNHMLVTLDRLINEDSNVDTFAIETLKMFAGKNGDFVDVYGNSNHPNAYFFYDETIGFNWAFVASSNEIENIAVAQVGLPPSNLDESNREVLLVDYSIVNVFTDLIFQAYPYADSAYVAAYLSDGEAPGFFNEFGFIQGGTAPSANYDDLLIRIEALNPYNPTDIQDIELNFE